MKVVRTSNTGLLSADNICTFINDIDRDGATINVHMQRNGNRSSDAKRNGNRPREMYTCNDMEIEAVTYCDMEIAQMKCHDRTVGSTRMGWQESEDSPKH